MSDELQTGRRGFLKAVTAGVALQPLTTVESPLSDQPAKLQESISYPRSYSGRHLSLLGFPLGGIGTGSISIGGRGQLRDWEIYNRADKDRSPEYAFASIWLKSGDSKPIAHVLEVDTALREWFRPWSCKRPWTQPASIRYLHRRVSAGPD